jgi:ribosome biogenesis protein BMS1
LRKAQGVPVVPRPDSLYTKIERPEVRRFNPLHVPKRLQATLPFASRPKAQKAKAKGGDYFTKRAVVMDKPERAAYGLMQRVFTVAKEKVRVAKAKRAGEKEKYETKKATEGAGREERGKETKKRKYQAMGMAEGRGKRAKKDRGGDE